MSVPVVAVSRLSTWILHAIDAELCNVSGWALQRSPTEGSHWITHLACYLVTYSKCCCYRQTAVHEIYLMFLHHHHTMREVSDKQALKQPSQLMCFIVESEFKLNFWSCLQCELIDHSLKLASDLSAGVRLYTYDTPLTLSYHVCYWHDKLLLLSVILRFKISSLFTEVLLYICTLSIWLYNSAVLFC